MCLEPHKNVKPVGKGCMLGVCVRFCVLFHNLSQPSTAVCEVHACLVYPGIQVCAEGGITRRFLFFSDVIETRKILF